MKKAKIMLMALTVLSVVGGALAFKAKTNTGVFFCTGDAGIGQACPVSINSITSPDSPTQFYYAETNVANPENPCLDVKCTDLTSFTHE